MPHILMRRPLGGHLEMAVWPERTVLKTYTQDSARDCHFLLQLAYRNGGGSVPAFDAWWTALFQDNQYDPGLCFPVEGDGHLIGFAQCWTSGFVKDFVVHPHHRRRGVGRALLTHIVRAFAQKDAKEVCLKVETDNLSAIQFYEKLGFSGTVD